MVPKWQWLIFRRTLGRTNRFKPFSRAYGHERGRPIDRFFIDRFIAAESDKICGRVLEVGDSAYTQRYGGDRVTQPDVLSPVPGDPGATIIADLQDAPQIPDDTFDCVVLTQVLPCIYDTAAAVRTLRRILRPGGVVLATVPFIGAISGTEMGNLGDYWRISSRAAHRMFADAFGAENVEIRTYGNLVLAVAFLYGFAVEDLDPHDFDPVDPLIELVSTIKATKPAAQAPTG